MERALGRAGQRPARADAEPAVLELVRRHGGRLMSVARRYSSSVEDAEDAYQRAVEISLTRAPSTDPAELLPWMKTVVKHEAFAVARQRTRHGTPSELETIEPLAGLAAGPAELAERRDRLRLGAEALRRLKPQEVRALLLRAEGLSYREICAATGWSYTKVNRCLSEGRQSFLDRVAGIEGGEECGRLAPLVSRLADGEASEDDLAALRPHLSGCLACRARLREYRRAPTRAAAAVVPGGAVASLLDSLRGAAHAVQSAVGSKAAAVAASTAVLAAGGATTVGVVGGSGSEGPPAHGRAAPPRGRLVVPRALPVRYEPPTTSRPRRTPSGSARAQRRARKPRGSPSLPSSGEFAPTAAMRGAPSRAAPPPAAQRAPPAPRGSAPPGQGGEFAP